MNPYQQIAGAVQPPVVALLWTALLLFFGYQYQASASLPRVSTPTTAELLEQQNRYERLAKLAVQTTTELPTLLDPQDFSLDLSTALNASDFGRGTWQPSAPTAQKVNRIKASESHDRAPVQQSAEVKPTQLVEPFIATPVEVVEVVGTDELAAVESAKPTVNAVVTPESSKALPPKFVRIPARKIAQQHLAVDDLRAYKDQARMHLKARRAHLAYDVLRGRVVAGRADIEFLGLLALASLSQQPLEAQLLYQHLVQLQPDVKRWQQGLAVVQQQLNAAAS